MPPALLDGRPACRHCPCASRRHSLAGDAAASKPLPISTPLTALIDIRPRRCPGRAWRISVRRGPPGRRRRRLDPAPIEDPPCGYRRIISETGTDAGSDGRTDFRHLRRIPVPVGPIVFRPSTPARRARPCRAPGQGTSRHPCCRFAEERPPPDDRGGRLAS